MKFNEGRTTEPRRSEPECKKAKETWNHAPKAKIMCPKAKCEHVFKLRCKICVAPKANISCMNAPDKDMETKC